MGLSVIIPCYKSHDTLEKCLKSLENNVIDTEVIIIDDCPEFDCKDLVKQYSRSSSLDIRYLCNSINLGAGESRNQGIKLASKEYLTFLDSDDVFSSEYFYSIKGLINQELDVIVYDAKHVYLTTEVYMKMFFSAKIKQGLVKKEDALVFIKGCTCGKIYRTSLIQNNNVLFGDTPINEDLLFTKIAFSFADSIFYIEKALYHYLDNASSLMNNIKYDTSSNSLISFSLLKERINRYLFAKELNSIFLIEVLYSTTNTMIRLGESLPNIRDNYIQLRKEYDKSDPYRERYSLVYRISFFLLDLHLFALYIALRKKLRK